MPHELRRRLCVPAILAVTTITAAPACQGDDKKMTDSAGETLQSGTDTTATTTATTGATDTGSGTDTDGVPDCRQIADQATCEATPLCVWPDVLLQCAVDCMQITDEAVCGVQQFCFWENGVCEQHII